MNFQFFIAIQILLAILFVQPTAVFACGSSKNCCEKTERAETPQKNCCSDDSTCANSEDSENDCGGDCQHDGCPCQPASAHVPAALADAPVEFFIASDAHLPTKTAWYFTAKIPKPVHLAIWLPPKI